MNTKSSPSPRVPSVALIAFAGALLLGVGTGFIFSQKASKSAGAPGVKVSPNVEGKIIKGQVYGSLDVKAFRDSAQGTLEKGGLDGEGSHKLIRPGGESQTAYLTSSTLDLDQFVGRKVKMWGETYKAAKAGWFMDVGRLEVVE